MKKIALLIASMIMMGSSNTTSEQEHLANYPFESFKKVLAWDMEMNKQVEIHKEVKKEDEGYIYKFKAKISAYTNGVSECGKSPDDPDYGITASGEIARPHHTIAASRSIPLNSVVRIQGLDGVFYVEDRGGAIKGRKVDMFVSSLDEADKWGVQERDVYILKLGGKKGE